LRVVTLISQLPLSIHLYLSGARSFILRLKNPLQPSQVIAPKWTPDDGALQTLHGKALNNSATVGLFGFSVCAERKMGFKNKNLLVGIDWICLLETHYH
jgi:hypothetical protein